MLKQNVPIDHIRKNNVAVSNLEISEFGRNGCLEDSFISNLYRQTKIATCMYIDFIGISTC